MSHPLIFRSVLTSIIKELQRKDFKTSNSSPNFSRQEAALVDYKAEIIHLTSSEGASLGVPESKSSKGDIRLPDVRGKAHHQVITRTCHHPPFTKASCHSRATADCAVLSQALISDQNIRGRVGWTPPHSLLMLPRLPPLDWNHGRRTSRFLFEGANPESRAV